MQDGVLRDVCDTYSRTLVVISGMSMVSRQNKRITVMNYSPDLNYTNQVSKYLEK
ncbi:hypothetical protein MPCS_01405 [Candidatus Megaera polyxenophila]|nr:hypothetical protein MPCS_01405 [Candidatus Megaera polyxenophila]